ncbi:hypothetical protein FGO68_gene10038 [Halteria grandinella]|uniref:MORN repeat-containing protein n=1 Tax=Halteria grandinella TaxID=5974 RepID=A0A8J8NSD1_HALGN|nr:hypothetical protein FGO68_gene10038 [Halteria grandinella]
MDVQRGLFDKDYELHGPRRTIRINDVCFEGEWKGFSCSGYAKMIDRNRHYYEGHFLQGNMRWGICKEFGGNIYEGHFQYESQYHGPGKMTYTDGTTWEGNWDEDFRRGEGRLTQVNGDYSIGKWEWNYPTGNHKFYSKDGTLIKEAKLKQ